MTTERETLEVGEWVETWAIEVMTGGRSYLSEERWDTREEAELEMSKRGITQGTNGRVVGISTRLRKWVKT